MFQGLPHWLAAFGIVLIAIRIATARHNWRSPRCRRITLSLY